MKMIYNDGIAPVLVGRFILEAHRHTLVPDDAYTLILSQNAGLIGEDNPRFVPPIMRYNDTE